MDLLQGELSPEQAALLPLMVEALQTLAPKLVPDVQPVTADGPLLLSLPEVAELLGMGERTVYQYIKAHGLPTVQLPGGGQRRVLRRELLEWIEGLPR